MYTYVYNCAFNGLLFSIIGKDPHTQHVEGKMIGKRFLLKVILSDSHSHFPHCRQWGYSVTEGDSSYMQLTTPITATQLLFGSACTDSSVFLSISPTKILSNKIELIKLEGVDTPARAGVGFRWFIICY